MRNVRVAITIAGSDSIGGAGIQADLKTFSALGVYGTTAVTAITAQNTFGVSKSFILPGELVYEQIKAVAEDSGIDAGKTGMLGNSEVVESVVRALKDYEFPIIVDPVMVAKTGAKLVEDKAVELMKSKLFPESLCITPNLDEAEVLSGKKINGVEDMVSVAEEISEEYSCWVLLKGGHLKSERIVDILYYRGNVYRFEGEKRDGCYHGTGCSLSAGITAGIALGLDLVEAVKLAKEIVELGINYSDRAGRNCDSVNPLAYSERKAIAFEMMAEMRNALKELERVDRVNLMVPEVGMNFAYAMPPRYLRNSQDVLSLNGRITRGKHGLAIPQEIEFGASRHLARALITYMNYFPDYRAVVNLRFDERLIEIIRGLGLVVSSYDRSEEPEEIKKVEGATIPWGIKTAIEKAKKRPDAIFHKGDFGKEPITLLFARNPAEIVEILRKIAYDYN